MKKKQVKKYATLTTASVMTMQLTACNTTTSVSHEVVEEEINVVDELNEQIIEQPIDEVVEDEYLASVYDSEFAGACDDWDEQDDGSYECIDENSDYYSEHFFEGVMFASLAAMAGSTIYKTYNSKNGINKKPMKVTDLTNSNSGGGTSSSYSNSGSSSVKEKTPTVKPNTNTNSTSSTSTTKNSTNNSNSSYSTSSSSNNSYTNSSTNSSSSSSYSSGKSGFSSGGTSRGGSSSS
ncbi:hypothetical protein [Lysinibacillus antri]|uniref:Uncharacterized protein n=1 Tax=Lysinibacillus antri TaxID=2498145 RepID=A0A432LA18_9BACI|nr:hypothetical protein [Lysinibacillus antri]RUL50919.1 hypothetical protein EK386_13305 [Lysinibacillus antri]